MKPLLRTIRMEEALNTMFGAVKEFLPENETPYAEPFCGVAEVPFTFELKNCVLNDDNPHIINFYQWVKSGDFLKNDWLITRKTDRPSWGRNRNEFNELIRRGEINTVKAAQLTFYLSHMCQYFNFGTTGTLIGEHEVNGELPEVDWNAAAALMQNWEISHGDYADFDVPEGASLVVNAPGVYVRQWHGGAWDVSDHEALISWLEQHSNRTLVFHRRRRVVEELYALWVERGNAPQAADEVPQEGSEVPQAADEAPQEGSETPQATDEVPQVGNEMPQEAMKCPKKVMKCPRKPMRYLAKLTR